LRFENAVNGPTDGGSDVVPCIAEIVAMFFDDELPPLLRSQAALAIFI
jgi:hypothetical protein